MKKYLARNSTWGKLIELVEIERETESSVWIGGRRNSKISDYHCYFDSFDEAKAHLLEKADEKVIGARRSLELANSHLGNIKGLKEPV